MRDFVEKPEDFDLIMHDNTRFVIIEKTEEISISFLKRMKIYWGMTRKLLLLTLDAINIFKTK